MSELIRKVGTHGFPNPDEHPWVIFRGEGESDNDWSGPHRVEWLPRDFGEWVPWAPPTEYAPEPEPEGVEVDGTRYRLDGNVVQVYLDDQWHTYGTAVLTASNAQRWVRVAQALGLVPGVPQTLIDWLRDYRDRVEEFGHGAFATGELNACQRVLEVIEAGEFGAVEPSVEPAEFHTGSEPPAGKHLCWYSDGSVAVVDCIGGKRRKVSSGPSVDVVAWFGPLPAETPHFDVWPAPAPSVEWVTDRLPRDDEYPVLVNDAGLYFVSLDFGQPGVVTTDRWVSVEALLDAARLR